MTHYGNILEYELSKKEKGLILLLALYHSSIVGQEDTQNRGKVN
jgi:hypothetical protein